jgi:hypothetical protein
MRFIAIMLNTALRTAYNGAMINHMRTTNGAETERTRPPCIECLSDVWQQVGWLSVLGLHEVRDFCGEPWVLEHFRSRWARLRINREAGGNKATSGL